MPHPQRVNRPSPPVPTGSSREKPTFFHRQSFMFNASSGRKELLCTERERERSRIFSIPARSQKRGSRDRELRPRDRGERSDPSGGSFRLIRLNPSPSVCVALRRGAPFLDSKQHETGYEEDTTIKRRKEGEKTMLPGTG